MFETKWFSGMLRWQRVVGRVREVFKVTVLFCVESKVALGST